MDFFAAQDRSRRLTRRLILSYLVATSVIVVLVTGVVLLLLGQGAQSIEYGSGMSWLQQQWPIAAGSAAGTAGFIGLASIYKVARLSAGGASVARDLGGTAVTSDVKDPLRRRLRNVVEEMAIASGVPVPEIFVLEEENAINAFAAGFSSEDAAIAVTRGTLENLSRDELQGVIAHEFSHILNGDMRLNIRLMGILFGILAIAMIGRLILRGSSRSRSSSRNGGAAAGVALGAALFVIGYVGVFFGRLIKAGVSRQREFLADASAVQFTRQTDGIAGALKKIGGLQRGSQLDADPEEVSHMLFALGSRKLAGLFATHPPLADRISALDPSFRPEQLQSELSSPLGHETLMDDTPTLHIAPLARGAKIQPSPTEEWLNDSGRPEDEHIHYAGKLLRSIPELLASAAHSRDHSLLLAIALVLDSDDAQRARQLVYLDSQLGELRSRRVASLYDEYATLGAAYRLPLLDLAFPALKDRPTPQIEFLIEIVDRLIHMDGQVDLFEYAIARVLQGQLSDALYPRRPLIGRARLARSAKVQRSAQTVVAIFASHGHESAQQGDEAFGHGMRCLNVRLSEDARLTDVMPADWVSHCDKALTHLNLLDGRDKRTLLRALIEVAGFDNGLTVAEAEMLRAIAAVLQVPLTPLLNEAAIGSRN